MYKKIDTTTIPTEVLSFLAFFLAPIRKYIIISAIIITLASLVYVIDGILIRDLTNKILDKDYSGIYWFALYYFIFWESLNWLWRGMDYLQIKTYPHIKNSITDALMQHAMMHSHQYYQNNFAGNIAKKISDASMGCAKIYFYLVLVFLRKLLTMVFPLGLLFYVNTQVGILMTAWCVVFVFICIYFSKVLVKYSSVRAEVNSVISGKVVDTISNMPNVRMFARRRFESKFLEKYLKQNLEADTNFFWAETKVNYIKSFCNSIGVGSLVLILLFLVLHGGLTTADFILVMTVCMGVTMETWDLSNEIGEFNEQVGVVKQALDVVLVPPQIIDEPNAKKLIVNEGVIAFENVTFRYHRNNNLFKNKSVLIKAGEKVGLVGFSGSGKSTFVNLITRAFDVEAGRILIDGQDIKKVTQDSLRENISFIPQDPVLFHRSLLENIRYGNSESTDEEVLVASKKAHVHDFAIKTEDGYNTLVGERGLKLSGGQRQRIAIARAILKNAPILILDEATSSLDSMTEKLIQDSFNLLMKKKTTIVVAHRLSTLLEMDRILVFDQGSIIEEGSHRQLLLKKGTYHMLWNSQIGGFLPESK